jgi:translation initiation factor 3 subunit M
MVVASSTLVNVSEDAEMRLVGLLAEAAPTTDVGQMQSFQDECTRSINEGNATSLLQTIMESPEAMSALMVLDTEQAVAAVSLLAALLQKVRPPDREAALAQALVDAIVRATSLAAALEEEAGGEEDMRTAQRKIALLSVLYNMRTDAHQKCSLLSRMLQLASTHPDQLLADASLLGRLLQPPAASAHPTTTTTGGTAVAASGRAAAPAAARPAGEVPRLVAVLDSWNRGGGAAAAASVRDRRELYSTICSVLPAADLRKQRFLLLLTETYNTQTPDQVDSAGVAAAREAAAGAVRDPVSLFHHQRNLLRCPAVQALRKDHAPLLQLLAVFQAGMLSDYESFVNQHAAAAGSGSEEELLQQWGLDAAQCRRNMRILSLCSLAAEHEEIPYQVIADTLQLDDSSGSVETWVIAAVNSGLLEAKMDQLAGKVLVERAVVRRFDEQQWKKLQSRLSLWKQNVGSILAALQQSQAATATTT